MTDNLYTSQESREKLMVGVMKAANAIAVTLGTSGSNSLIQALEKPHFFPTNDGANILSSIRFADPLEEMGRLILFEAVSRANRKSGDGSSTTAVLCAAVLREGMQHIGKVSPMDLKRSLEACIPLIEESISKQKKEITVDTVAQAASISAEDEGIGNMIQEIYQKIGKDGIITWDTSKTSEDGYSIGTGLMVYGSTYVSPYMCDVDGTGTFSTSVKLENPAVLLCKQKIVSARDFNSLFYQMNNEGKKDIVIFCDDIEFPAIADLVKTRIEKGFRAVVVKMPILWRDEWWEDLALTSGATVIDIAAGTKIQDVNVSHLGTFEHITIDKENTYIDGIKDISKHIMDLQVSDKDKDLVRAARLNTRTARYFVGAHSESALKQKRDKVEDAINAASCALQNGVVAGGGVALLNASKLLPQDTIGGTILKEALKAPIETIIRNAGDALDIIEQLEGNEGYNSKTGTVEDMFEQGIVDAYDVVLNAVRAAIGVAAGILTVGSVVVLPREDEKETK